MFSAIKSKNFRTYMVGQFVSFVGTWMQQVAMGWLVYRMTKSAFWLGVATFSAQLPMFLLVFIAGVYVDRLNKHKLLILTQVLASLQALALAWLTYNNSITLTWLIIFNLILGTINAFDMTTRQAFLPDLVSDRSQLPNAIATNSTVINATRLIGPAVAGITISAFGEAFCFFANAMSYLAVIYALLKVRVAVKPKIQQHTSIVQSLKGGFEATFNHPSIKWIILFLGFMSLVGLPFNTVFPALAAAQKNGDSHTLGWVTSATGFGALLGALYLVRRSSSPLLGRRVVKAALQFSVALILISFGWRLEILLLLLVVAGMGMMILMAGCNTIVQTVIPDHLRGRVMSFFNFALLGVSPFGNLLFGASTQEWGIQVTFLTHGIICVIGSLYFFKMSETINKTVSQHFRQQGHHVEL